MSIKTLPLHLYKANTELQLRVTELLQQSGHCWLEAVEQSSADTTAEIEELLRSANWQSLVTLPSESFWRLLQQHVGDTRAISQVAIKNQSDFTTGLRQALEHWQKTVAEVISMTEADEPLQDLFKQWGTIWTTAATAPQGKAAKAR
jgi:hypothetical protein